MEGRNSWTAITPCVTLLTLTVLMFSGCYWFVESSTTWGCGISGPTMSDGKVIDPNLYITFPYTQSGRMVLRDKEGREVFSHVLPPASRFTIAVKGQELVLSNKAGENLFQIPVAATPTTKLRHEPVAKEMSKDRFTFLVHVETGSNDTVFKTTLELPDN